MPRAFTEFSPATRAFEKAYPNGVRYSQYQIAPAKDVTGLRVQLKKAIQILGYDILAEAYEFGSAPITPEQYRMLLEAHTNGI